MMVQVEDYASAAPRLMTPVENYAGAAALVEDWASASVRPTTPVEDCASAAPLAAVDPQAELKAEIAAIKQRLSELEEKPAFDAFPAKKRTNEPS